MFANDPKAMLARYLDIAHDALLWKLDGLSEYDIRRPLTPTGTNLLGIVKHVAWVELGYFGEVFDRPHGISEPANADEPNADMYATADESRDDIVDLFAAARTHAKETIEALDLDARGHVPWWGDVNPVTLEWIIVHMATEIHRHLGQADILREGFDGFAGPIGHRDGVDNLPDVDEEYWPAYVAELEAIALNHAGRVDIP